MQKNNNRLMQKVCSVIIVLAMAFNNVGTVFLLHAHIKHKPEPTSFHVMGSGFNIVHTFYYERYPLFNATLALHLGIVARYLVSVALIK